MIGMILKDIIQIRNKWIKWKNLLLVISVLTATTFLLRQDGWIVTVFLMFILINSVQSLFISDGKDRWLAYLLTVPENLSRIILSRYLVALAICVTGLLINVVFLFIVNVFLFNLGIVKVGIITICIFMISIIYTLFILPFLYAFNQNGLTLGVITLFTCILILLKFTKIRTYISKIVLSSNIYNLSIIAVVFVLIIVGVSYVISYLILKTLED